MEHQYCIILTKYLGPDYCGVFCSFNILCLVKELYWSCCFVGNLSDDGDDPSRLINNRGVIDDEDGKT